MGQVTHKFVCFTDKFAVKRGTFYDVGDPVCPHCRETMVNVGTKAHIPKKLDVKGWKALQKRVN